MQTRSSPYPSGVRAQLGRTGKRPLILSEFNPGHRISSAIHAARLRVLESGLSAQDASGWAHASQSLPSLRKIKPCSIAFSKINRSVSTALLYRVPEYIDAKRADHSAHCISVTDLGATLDSGAQVLKIAVTQFQSRFWSAFKRN
jgi:hypothetical protein